MASQEKKVIFMNATCCMMLGHIFRCCLLFGFCDQFRKEAEALQLAIQLFTCRVPRTGIFKPTVSLSKCVAKMFNETLDHAHAR